MALLVPCSFIFRRLSTFHTAIEAIVIWQTHTAIVNNRCNTPLQNGNLCKCYFIQQLWQSYSIRLFVQSWAIVKNSSDIWQSYSVSNSILYLKPGNRISYTAIESNLASFHTAAFETSRPLLLIDSANMQQHF